MMLEAEKSLALAGTNCEAQDSSSTHHYTAEPPSKPARVPVQVEDIPAVLKDRPQWVVWRWVWKGSKRKWDKPPYRADGKGHASSTDASTWAPFALAVEAYERGGFDGIGFVVTPDDPYCGVDLDKCLGEAWAVEMIEALDSYAEYTPSGNGYRVLVEASAESLRSKSKDFHHSKVEVYDSGRYFTVTGKMFGDVASIECRQSELESVCWPLLKVEGATPPFSSQASTVRTVGSDGELLGVMFRICKGSRELFAGRGCGDASADDLSLCNHLAFVTGKDAVRMDMLFRQSSLMRDKWDEQRGNQTYGQMTIAKAIEGTNQTYEPKTSSVPDSPSSQWRVSAASNDPSRSHGFAEIQDQPMEEGLWLHAKDNGRPLSTLSNFKQMLQHYGIKPRYNLVSKRDETLVPGLSATRDNHDNVTFAHVVSLANMNRLPVGQVGEYMLTIADQNAFNPILEWMRSKDWDGVDRLEEFLGGVEVPSTNDASLKDLLITRWMVSAVAAVALPSGFHARGVLVFTGPQGVGKTTWFRNLLPENLNEYFREGAILDPADKDSVTGAVSNWIVEIGELDATFRKADIARLKAFVTSGEDRIRKPYARAESMLPRRTVFCASVNDSQFLVDATGNSRFWTIEVESLRYERPCSDLQQLWAQVYAMFQKGEQWWLTANEERQLSESNINHEQGDPLEEQFLAKFDMNTEARQRATATDVLMALGYDKPGRNQQVAMSRILRKHCGDRTRDGRGRYFNTPLPKI